MDVNGVITHTEPINRRDVKVYMGESWLRDERGWYHAGWARIMVKKDGVDPVFEGAFTLNHDAHHIQLVDTFMKTRHDLDPVVGFEDEREMVVFRDSDVESGFKTQGLVGRDLEGLEGLEGRGYGVGEGEVMCPSDQLGFNVQPWNPINKMISEPVPKLAGRGLFASMFEGGLTKRQNVGGDIFGGSGNSAGVNLRSTIGNTDGCPVTRQVALIGVATDCTYTADFPDTEAVRSNIIGQINAA